MLLSSTCAFATGRVLVGSGESGRYLKSDNNPNLIWGMPMRAVYEARDSAYGSLKFQCSRGKLSKIKIDIEEVQDGSELSYTSELAGYRALGYSLEQKLYKVVSVIRGTCSI